MTHVLGVIAMANSGAPVKISLEATAFGDERDPLVEFTDKELRDPDVLHSATLARWYTASVLGWPSGHDVTVKAVRFDGLTLPVARGPSLFGALCMGNMRLVATDRPNALHGWSACLAEKVRNTPLDRVAVTADYDVNRGIFKPVGAIKSKLGALARLGRDICALCIVAPGQVPDKIPRTTVDRHTGCFVVKIEVSEQWYEIAVLEAASPSDAFRRLFALQTTLLARHVLQ
jgi:hypothetical protein